MSLLVLALSGACGKKSPPPQPPSVPKVDVRKLEDCLREGIRVERGTRYHTLVEGETLYRVSRMYGVSVAELIRVNNIKDHTDIDTGTRLVVPGAVMTQGIVWPLRGKLSSRFGPRGKRYHWGIDIPAPKGTPIKAAADGLVIVSANNLRGYSGYGRLVVIEHGNGIQTLYAHTSKNRVNNGKCIRAGDIIAEVGSTGRSTGNHLHFEVRQNGKAVNPLNYLP